MKGNTTSQFAYGADGLRRMMSVQTGTGDPVVTHYLVDGQSVVQEFREVVDEQQNVVLQNYAKYLNGPRGVEYRQDASGVRSWYLYDGLGSVIAEVDEGDNQSGYPRVTSTHASDVYGNTLASSGTSASSHKFVGGLGHVTDNDTGLMYMRARYYDPAIGRFVSEDPSGNGDNWYSHCGNNPVNNIDATGLFLSGMTFHVGAYFMDLVASMIENGIDPLDLLQ